ncbi:MAG: ABC transporter ATP-binding protein [Firmicutes bacterium]|nr:ABC transporter ATP-binding protein [Bacillota bacterium]
MIEARNLKKSFKGKTVLEYAAFTIGGGEFVGFYGPSGIGKSTAARVLCGLVKPDAGEVLLDGKPIAAPGMSYDRKAGLCIQMVFQQPHAALDPVQKLGSAFRELAKARFPGITRESAAELIGSSLAEAGLDAGILARLPSQISGGEAQRVCIARCLMLSPRLLILDEATSMLDVSTQANVMGAVTRAARARGGSILLISHDRALIERVCQRIYLFEGGRTVEERV